MRLKYKWCCQEFSWEVLDFIVEEGQVAYLSKERFYSDLSPMGGCSLEEGACRLANASLVWQAAREIECDYEEAGEFEVELAGNRLIVPQLASGLSFSHKRSLPCHPNVYLSDNEVGFRFADLSISPLAYLPSNRTPPPNLEDSLGRLIRSIKPPGGLEKLNAAARNRNLRSNFLAWINEIKFDDVYLQLCR